LRARLRGPVEDRRCAAWRPPAAPPQPRPAKPCITVRARCRRRRRAAQVGGHPGLRRGLAQ
jgi:hypothetical protein